MYMEHVIDLEYIEHGIPRGAFVAHAHKLGQSMTPIVTIDKICQTAHKLACQKDEMSGISVVAFDQNQTNYNCEHVYALCVVFWPSDRHAHQNTNGREWGISRPRVSACNIVLASANSEANKRHTLHQLTQFWSIDGTWDSVIVLAVRFRVKCGHHTFGVPVRDQSFFGRGCRCPIDIVRRYQLNHINVCNVSIWICAVEVLTSALPPYTRKTTWRVCMQPRARAYRALFNEEEITFTLVAHACARLQVIYRFDWEKKMGRREIIARARQVRL